MIVKDALAAHAACRRDAERLLLHCLDLAHEDRAWLIAHDTDELPNKVP